MIFQVRATLTAYADTSPILAIIVMISAINGFGMVSSEASTTTGTMMKEGRREEKR